VHYNPGSVATGTTPRWAPQNTVRSASAPAGAGSGRPHVARGQHDLDVRGQEPGSRGLIAGLVHHPAHRRRGRLDLALRQPQLREAGLGVAPRLAGLAVGLLGPRELAAQPVELGLEIQGPADPWPPDGLREALARLPGLAYGVVQLTPPGSACSIFIGKGLTTAAPGSVQGMLLIVDDIQAARAELAAHGAAPSEVFHFDGTLRVTGTQGRLPGPDPATAGCCRRSPPAFRDAG
jgi:hypothetical protein